jgi:hypothetical protein
MHHACLRLLVCHASVSISIRHAPQHQEMRMWDNTLLLVVSDNGGPIYAGKSEKLFGGASNALERGQKKKRWEGGIRVRSFLSGGFLPEARRGVKLEGFGHFAGWLVARGVWYPRWA